MSSIMTISLPWNMRMRLRFSVRCKWSNPVDYQLCMYSMSDSTHWPSSWLECIHNGAYRLHFQTLRSTLTAASRYPGLSSFLPPRPVTTSTIPISKSSLMRSSLPTSSNGHDDKRISSSPTIWRIRNSARPLVWAWSLKLEDWYSTFQAGWSNMQFVLYHGKNTNKFEITERHSQIRIFSRPRYVRSLSYSVCHWMQTDSGTRALQRYQRPQ